MAGKPKQTIRNLLLATLQTDPNRPQISSHDLTDAILPSPTFTLGTGKNSFSVRLSGLDVDGFRDALRGLPNHTALTPVTNSLTGMDIGQPLLRLALGNHRYLSIHPHHPELSLLEQRMTQNAGSEKSRLGKTIELINTLAGDHPRMGANNPFIAIFDETYRLAFHGHPIDTRSKNIAIDKQAGKLRLIGALDNYGAEVSTVSKNRRAEKGVSSMDSLGQTLVTELVMPPKAGGEARSAEVIDLGTLRQYQIKCDLLQKLLKDAQQTVAHRYEKTDPSPLIFKTVGDTKAISLNASPRALFEKLRQMQDALEIPQRG